MIPRGIKIMQDIKIKYDEMNGYKNIHGQNTQYIAIFKLSSISK